MDAITLEVMRNRFFAITEEMGAALIRTAYVEVIIQLHCRAIKRKKLRKQIQMQLILF